MAKIDYVRTGEYLRECLLILKEKGGECPSAELINEMANRLNLSDYEKSLNESGHYRWTTRFRFYSIGLVKAGWILKNHGVWILTKDGYEFEKMTPVDIYNFTSNEYDKWNSLRKGIENKEDDIEEENEEPKVLMQVKPDDITFQNLLSGIESCKIQIPPFQRSFVWVPSDIRYLLDSIYRGYPIGSFIFWKTTRKLPRTRNIGNITISPNDINPGTEISYVLDGQQRITSLFAAVKGSTIDGENFRFIFDLRLKKFLVKKIDQIDPNEQVVSDLENLQISVGSLFTESRATYNQTLRTYPTEYHTILDTLYDRFVSYRFSVIQVVDELSGSEDEDQSEGVKQVVNMFSRINETGRKLTVVAKMVARCWGEGYDLRESLDEFFDKDPNLNSIREETLLQSASVILNHRKCKSRDILDRTNIQKLELEWDEIIKAFLLSIHFIKTKLKIRNLDYLPFDAVLVPLTYLFYKKHEPSHSEVQLLEQWFWRACLSNRYDSTVESKIEEDCIAFDEILEGKNSEFAYLIDWDTLKSRLIAQRYNLRNAFVKTVLSLYSFAEPKNLTDGRDVSLDKVFSGYYKHNLHHIFPQAYLRRNEPGLKEWFDSIVNIMFVPSITNGGISDKEPAKYISEFQNSNPEMETILARHFISDLKSSHLLENKFTEFLDYRADQIVKAFRVRTGVVSASEEHFINDPSRPIDILESKIRTFIHDLLRQKTEDSYWKDYIPVDIQESVDKKIQGDLIRHPYGIEEYMRDDVRITYLDIMDYEKIINLNWETFESYLGSRGEVTQHFRALKNYRNPVKHLRDLNEVDRRNGEAAVLWLENILK
jgi:hypothetical protein